MIPLPNIPLPFFAPAAPLPVSAVSGRATAPKPVAQPSRAGIGRNCALPQTRRSALRVEFSLAAPVRWLDRVLMEARTHTERQAAKRRLQLSLDQLLDHAAREAWSQRELSRRAGIPESSLRRLRRGTVDALAWLPKIQPALRRLNPV
jgi:hypothetical protein